MSAAHTVQIGIRSSGERAAREYVADQGGQIFTARALRGLDGAGLQPADRRRSVHASASGPVTSRWTSTAWTRPLRPAPAHPSRAA